MFPRFGNGISCSLLICTTFVTGCATSIGIRDPSKTAMMAAAASGDTGRAKELIAQGTEVNFTDRRLSPLGVAIIGGHLATARALLDGGATARFEVEGRKPAHNISLRPGNLEAEKMLT